MPATEELPQSSTCKDGWIRQRGGEELKVDEYPLRKIRRGIWSVHVQGQKSVRTTRPHVSKSSRFQCKNPVKFSSAAFPRVKGLGLDNAPLFPFAIVFLSIFNPLMAHSIQSLSCFIFPKSFYEIQFTKNSLKSNALSFPPCEKELELGCGKRLLHREREERKEGRV